METIGIAAIAVLVGVGVFFMVYGTLRMIV